MPAPRKVDLLPDEIRQELDRKVVANGFGGYIGLSEWLSEKGYEIKKSALAEHGAGLERWLRAIKTSTQGALAIAAAAPDEEDQRSAAVLSMLQTGIFDVMVALQEIEATAPEETVVRAKLYGDLARAVAELSRASVHQKKFATEVQGRVRQAAASATKIAKRSGLTEAAAAEIRAAILGIQG